VKFDLIKSIQLLPGVSTVGEGASGFNVRGGSIDQNLILLDEAPVYNSSHLFGFFSVFNPDAVKDVKLFKGGINAKYGGRLASILDVRLKEGNKKQFAAQGGVGIIFSRLTLEGPIKKGKGSYIIAGRRSYGDVLAAPFLAGNKDFDGLQLYFYDLTLKANYSLGKKR
jgi:outer membrane receptor protein involved in Fe transport